MFRWWDGLVLGAGLILVTVYFASGVTLLIAGALLLGVGGSIIANRAFGPLAEHLTKEGVNGEPR